MAFGDGLSRFSSISIVLIILIFVLMPLIHSSRSSVAAGNKARAAAQDIHQCYLFKRMGKRASSLVTDEESERQVPTGPDPLHHNNNPTARP